MLSIITDLASLGAAGIMGAMWLWERRASTQRERELTEAHERIRRDEQRLGMLADVVGQTTTAIITFDATQRETNELIKGLLEELHHHSIPQ